MKYVKPQITLLASASEAIQSDEIKPVQSLVDNHLHPVTLGTSPAYEADE